MIKKAMIMAAGVGSRLGVLSDIVPKPLVPIANIPVIDILLKHISSFGINEVIANTFFKAEFIQNHCKNNKYGVNFNYVTEKELSGTAGGLKKCQFFFDNEEDFIVLSADGLSDVNIEAAYNSHKASNAIATIVTKEVPHNEVSKYGIIVTDTNNIVESFQEKPSLDTAKSNLANTGIYIFKHEIFNFIPENTFYDFAKNVFVFLMNNNIKINTFKHNGYWSDIGSIEQYKQSNRDILDNLISFIKPKDVILSDNGKYLKDDNTIVNSSSKFVGNSIIGKNCIIGQNSLIKNSILWDNIKVMDNVEIDNSIVLPGITVKSPIRNEIISS